MAKIKKILETIDIPVNKTQTVNVEEIYPITSTKAVYDENNIRLDKILNTKIDIASNQDIYGSKSFMNTTYMKGGLSMSNTRIGKLGTPVNSDDATTKEYVDNLINTKQNKLSAGTGISILNNTISCTLDPTIFVIVTELPEVPEEGNRNKIHCVTSNISDDGENAYDEYIYTGGAWEKLGSFRPSIDLGNYAKLDKNNTFEYQQFFDSGINIKGPIFFRPVLNDASAMGQKIQNLQGAASTSKTGLIISDAYNHNTPLYGILVPEDPYDTSCAVNKAYVDNLISQIPVEKGTGVNSVKQKGSNNNASGNYSFAEGYGTNAGESYTHTEGFHTTANQLYEHAQGSFNKSNTGTLHSIGIGTSDDNRKNAEEVMSNGDKYLIGVGGYDGTNSQTEGIKSVQQVITSIDTKINDENFGGILCLNLGNTMDVEHVQQIVNVLQNITQNQKHYIITVYDTTTELFMSDVVLFRSGYPEYTLISNGPIIHEGEAAVIELQQFIYNFNGNGNTYTREMSYLDFISSRAYSRLSSRISTLENIISQITITEE